MKIITIWVLTLLTFNVNANTMNTPERTVIGLFIATDQQNWEFVAESFHDQVVLDYSSMNGNPASTLSPDQIVSAWKGILPGFESTHHQLGNMTTTLKGKSAEIFCYGTASHYLTDETGNIWWVVGTYDFELELIQNKWKITSMKFNFKYQDGNTTLPEKAINNLK